MKRTVLEKLKAKQLGERMMRDRMMHAGGLGDRSEERAAQAASEMVDQLLRRIIEKK